MAKLISKGMTRPIELRALSAAPYGRLVAGKFSDGLSSKRSPMRYRIARGMKDANDRRRHIIQKDTNFMTLLRHQRKGHGCCNGDRSANLRFARLRTRGAQFAQIVSPTRKPMPE
jgi:hypothetical protein